MDPLHLPTKVEPEGPKRELSDYLEATSYLVDQKFKDVVEALEPSVHQFFAVDVLWSDGELAGNRYWFFPCNRLDTVDREKTTKVFRSLWDPTSDGSFVFSKSQIGKHHIWIDKFMVSIMGILMSNEMHDALVSAGITGMGFKEFEETE